MAPKPAITAKKTSNRTGTTYVGDEVLYTITVTSSGTAPATNVLVTDNLPEGVTFIEGSAYVGDKAATGVALSQDGVLTIPVGDIPHGTATDVTFRVLVNEKAVGADIRNIGTVTGDDGVKDDFDDEDDDKVQYLTVTYDANGGKGAHADDKLKRGDDYTVLSRSNTGITRSGYTFTGWNSEPTGTGTSYAAGQTIVALNESMTLYARWSKDSGGGGTTTTRYTVTFHWNDGRTDDVHSKVTVREGNRVSKPTDPVLTDYTFTGWSTDKQGDDMYAFSSSVNKNTHLYAQWTAKGGALNYDDHYAYMHGYGDGTIRPTANIQRSEVAAIFYRLLTQTSRDAYWTNQNSFRDVSPDAWYNNVVSTMANLGVFTGYTDGTFRPDASITRAELATAAARFADDKRYDGKDLFSDIAGHWAADSINLAAKLGWMEGSGDGTFRPDDKITRAEVVTMFNRVLGRQPETRNDLLKNMVVWTDNQTTTAWYYLPMQEATNSHYFELKTDGVHETWISLREVPDWVALEKRN